MAEIEPYGSVDEAEADLLQARADSANQFVFGALLLEQIRLKPAADRYVLTENVRWTIRERVLRAEKFLDKYGSPAASDE